MSTLSKKQTKNKKKEIKTFQLTNENYYSIEANQHYFSVSQVKDFLKCEAYAMAKINGEWVEEPTSAMLIGSYVDSYFEGTLEEFTTVHPEIFKKDGTLKADFVKAEEIIKKVNNSELFMKCMSGEKQVIMTGEVFGAPWKIKMDSYIPHQAIVDLKVVAKLRDISYKNGFKQSFIEKWGYDLQLGIYQEVVRQNTNEQLDCIIAGVDKQDYSDMDCILIPNEQLEFARNQLRWKMEHIINVKNYNEEPKRCGVCDYCRATKKLERLILPDELIVF